MEPGFVKAESDNLPVVTVEMIHDLYKSTVNTEHVMK